MNKDIKGDLWISPWKISLRYPWAILEISWKDIWMFGYLKISQDISGYLRISLWGELPDGRITRAAVKEGGREGAEGGGVIQDMYSSGILYPWYKAVQGGTYGYVPVHPLLDTRRYKKSQNCTDWYIPSCTDLSHFYDSTYWYVLVCTSRYKEV